MRRKCCYILGFYNSENLAVINYSLIIYIYLIIVGTIFPLRKFKYLDLLQSEQIGIFFDRDSNPLYILMEKNYLDQDVM